MFSDGVKWRIGNGKQVQILGQPWLVIEENPFITSNPKRLQNQVVASLMCIDKNQWDMEVLTDMLNERDQACVLAVPTSNSNQEDRLYWSLENSGIYSVKSAYRLLQLQKRSGNVNEADNVWQIL